MTSGRRLRVHVLVAYYLPGSRAGGPTRSVSNLVRALGGRFDMRVYCLHHDFGDPRPYPGLAPHQWLPTPGGHVMYLSPGSGALARISAAAIDPRADVIYINSLLERRFSMLPLWTRVASRQNLRRVVLAPRGELAQAALANKPRRKRAYISALKARGVHRRVHWLASSDFEQQDIEDAMGTGVSVLRAPPLPTPPSPQFAGTRPKRTGSLRAIFVGRLLPHKGLHLALNALSRAQGRVHLDIAGPVEDEAYWRACQLQIAALPSRITATHLGVLSRPALEEALSRAEMFILPTRSENFGHAIAEGLSAGLPVLISDGTPWRNLRDEGVGWDLPLSDQDAFVAAIDEVTAMDESTHLGVRRRATAFARRTAFDPALVEANAKIFEVAAAS